MSNMSELTKLLDQMNDELNELRTTYKKRGQEIFKEAFKEFFDTNPEVHVFGWRQYTPYFNDGDTCTFRNYVDCAFISNAKDYDNIYHGEYVGEDETIWVEDPDYGDTNEEMIPESVKENTEVLRKFLSKIDNNVFLEMFGDHAQVSVTREGFDVQGYEHD